ncbi:MAG: hypothetical protein P1U86_14380 [Verrucomicrobiales bacterium]|nr:hypothetical protein [Verrucomicrobiales bacterium]
MVSFPHRCARLLAMAFLPVLLCQCKTQRTVLGTRPGSVSFAGGEKTGDTKEIRKKWADKGYKIDENGMIKADNTDLYSGEKAEGISKEFGKKQAKLGKSQSFNKEFKTPEFIKRQEFDGVSEARETGDAARESNKSNRAGSKLFGSKTKATSSMSALDTKGFGDSDKVFGTSENASVNRALENSPRATGSPAQMGYRDNAAMSFDDVKKMLNPGSYARNAELSN